MTPCQLENLNKLRDELRDRFAVGESNLTIKYIRHVPKITQLKN